jgi:UrcA family protein
MNSNIRVDTSPFHWTAILLACVLVAPNAFADDRIRTETVKFADLKVDTPAGVEVLYRRIISAARRVCSNEGSSIYVYSNWQNCVRPTVDAAVAKVNNPMLTALHAGREPSPATAMIKR